MLERNKTVGTVTGLVSKIETKPLNIGTTYTNGIDMFAHYKISDFDFNMKHSIILNFRTRDVDGSTEVQYAGAPGNIRWVNNFYTNYTWHGLTVTGTLRSYAPMNLNTSMAIASGNVDANGQQTLFRFKRYHEVDLAFLYKLPWDATVQLGFSNLFSNSPVNKPGGLNTAYAGGQAGTSGWLTESYNGRIINLAYRQSF